MKDANVLAVVGAIAHVHEDARKIISGFDANDSGLSFRHFTIKKEFPLGNHYHKEKDEVFFILKGSGRVILQPIDAGGRLFEVKTFFLKEGSVVQVPPFTAHTFILGEGGEMIRFSTNAFDAKDEYWWVLLMPEHVVR